MKRFLFYCSQLYCLSVLRPLQKEIRARGGEAAWFFDRDADFERFREKGEVFYETVAAVKGYDPHVVLAPGDIVPDFFPGIKVQVFHGLANDFVGKKGHYRIRGFFDLYCTRASEETRIFKEMARKYGHFDVTETGWPKLDPLFRGEVKDLRHDLGITRPIVFYASTFSPSMTSAPRIFPVIRDLSKKGRYHWLLTLHPKMPEAVVNQYRQLAGPNLTFFESHQDVLPLLQTADVMLCDTSSIMMEFMLLDKPLVTFRTMRPGPYLMDVRDEKEIEPAIERALERPAALMRAMREFIIQFNGYRDGRASERVIDAAEKLAVQGTGHLKKKPLNLLRKAKVRRKLGYYHLR